MLCPFECPFEKLSFDTAVFQTMKQAAGAEPDKQGEHAHAQRERPSEG